ncbi:MAG: RESPONSE REGULATOR PROTEIN-CheY-like nd an HD-GYP domain [uncultured Thermomicrobiales bacterium]|uniref:RESPONSE REGULATOR PROTEIN-CheY-like nd an HD-GYP domain n=1 Tax=uncultured Thermomicrobiales bacterium TaxID=1645740 RepID=A0A6J4VHD6_9BACT|nr:MAG: RESPONSE REGULATOR PROTEIN-CheY-like nd an HD-GYP domain [uncultured Thermomicrobiales bacterium]
MGGVPRRTQVSALVLVVVATIALALAFLIDDRPWTQQAVMVAVILFGMIAMAEVFGISFPLASGTFTVSVAASLSLAAGLTLGPVHGAMVVMAADLLESAYARRQPLKTSVNIASIGLSTLAAAAVYEWLAENGVTPVGSERNMLAAILAAAVYTGINTGSLAMIVAPAVGTTPLAMWRENFGGTVVEMVSLVTLGSLIPVLADANPPAILLLVLPLLGPHLAFERYRQAQREARSTMEGLADALEWRDAYTHRHSVRVADYVRGILEETPHIPHETSETIAAAARIHDVGKVGMRDPALNKPGPLTASERRELEQHPGLGAEIVGRLETYRPCAPLIRHHHERLDGTGYPDRLRGEEIPLGARIIAVADAFDAMTSDRVYRPAMSAEAALAELRKNSGTQFDPQIVASFERSLRRPLSRTSAQLVALRVD